MKYLLLAAAPLALAACEGAGGLTKAEQCAYATTALLLAEVNEVSPDALAQAKLNVGVFCPAPAE